MEQHISRLKYVILPTRPGFDFQSRDLCNQAYSYWKSYWQRIFRLKAPDFWDPLDFCRQSVVYCLFYENMLVAQNLSTFVHHDDALTYDIPYFHSFEGEAAETMKAKGVKKVMTLEYTSVHPGYGERRVGVRLAEIVNGLALHFFRELEFDATTGTPRRLSGLSEVTANYGYRKFADNIKKAGWELDVFVGFKGELKEHPDPEYRAIIRQLWERRNDLSGATVSKSNKLISHIEEFEMTTTTNIRTIYRESMSHLSDKFDSFNWADKDSYSLWLGQAYYLVRHTTRLLALCAGYCPFEYEDTHKRTLAHLREEDGHDSIAVADFKALGVDINSIPELKETSALIRLQYEQMASLSGCAFFGYILLLEGLAVTKAESIHAVASAKFGPRTTRFLKTHSEDDIEHIEQAFLQIEKFSASDQQIVVNNLVQSTKLYSEMLDHVRTKLESGAPIFNYPAIASAPVMSV